MSGANASAASGLQDQHDAEQRNHEPSMEEILASIRRIISDDQMLPLSPRASLPPLSPNEASGATQLRQNPEVQGPVRPDPQSPAHHDAQDEHADVLDLAEVAQHGDDDRRESYAHTAQETQASGDHHPDEPASNRAADGTHEHVSVAEPEQPAAPTSQPPLRAGKQQVAPEPAHAPDTGREPHPTHEPIVSVETMSSVSSHFHQLTAAMLMQNFPPVEQIARELLRPMVKTWLDDNLPVMVERLVRAEIERVARVGR